MIRPALRSLALALSCAASVVAEREFPAADELRLNQLQAIGSHNSYHLAPPESMLAHIARFRPDGAEAWNYSHPPLAGQLDAGLRQFELDLFLDPEGGRFSDPLVPRLVRMVGGRVPAFGPAGLLREPGTKVLHVPDIDCWSNVPSLRAALREMADWSARHPGHLPVMVLLECKEQHHPPLPTRPLPFTREALLELEREILEAMPREKLFTPDDLRGEAASPREALRDNGWPRLAELRGKFLLMLDNGDPVRARYLEENPTLKERLMFVSAPDADHPAAAWFKRNDPVRQFDEIRDLVERGYVVRTRSDSGPADAEMRERAFASGAQWISSDHLWEDADESARVRFPDGSLVRPNPRTASE